jgi:hypothetical protein
VRAKVQYNRTRSYFRAMFEWGMTEHARAGHAWLETHSTRVPIEKGVERKKIALSRSRS